MAFTVILLPRVRADIRAIGEWFGTRSRSAEARWRQQLLRVVTNLSTDPGRYPQAEDAADLEIDLREVLIGRRRGIIHRILFTIDGDTVYVHRVRHASQDQLSEDDI
jgi:plasmid stabilization system protein ParE